MRTARMLGGLALLFAAAVSAQAQSPREATITATEVEARSGPSATYYATSKLYHSDRVTVLREQDKDWLAIQPPNPGTDSFSWVNAAAVQNAGANSVVVKVQETPIRVGSRLVKQSPTVEQAKVTQGTLLTVIGQPEVAPDGSRWLPILPVPSEVRYIPASAVATTAPPPLAQPSLPSALAPSKGTQPTVAASYTAPAAAAPPAATDPQLTRAEQADLASNFGEAIRLYEQVARETRDQDLRLRCLNRSQFLRDALAASDQRRAQAFQASQSAAPVEARLASLSRSANPPPANPRPALQTPASSQYCYVPEPCSTVRLRSPVLNTAPPPLASSAPAQAPAPATQSQWYGPYLLTYTRGLAVDEKPTYRLESVNGQFVAYVTAGPDVDLMRYDRRAVQVYGTMAYHGQVRTYYMSVQRVTPAQ